MISKGEFVLEVVKTNKAQAFLVFTTFLLSLTFLWQADFKDHLEYFLVALLLFRVGFCELTDMLQSHILALQHKVIQDLEAEVSRLRSHS